MSTIVNLFGPLALIRAALPGMRARRSGYVINISSISGIRAYPGAAFYAASKFGLEGLCEGLAPEVEPFGIRVMIVQPGYFRTAFAGRSVAMAANSHPDYPELARRRSMVKRGDGLQPGDPMRGVAAIMTAMESEAPPLRLLLGRDAYEIASDAYGARQAEADAWRAVSEETGFAE